MRCARRHVFYVGCTINLCSALLSALLSTLAVRSWALRASSGSADSDDVEASSAAAAEDESARYAKHSAPTLSW